jgi:hypothetical protein
MRIKNELFTNQQIAALANQNYLAYYIDLENFDNLGDQITSILKYHSCPRFYSLTRGKTHG